MVSTHPQYLSDFTSSISNPVDSGKSPLAMLAKTCETIGLPDTPVRKNAHEKIRDVQDPSVSSREMKKEGLSPSSKKKEGSKSPITHSPSMEKKTPISSEPSTSSAALPANFQSMLTTRSCFPMPFPPLPTNFPSFSYQPMIPAFPAVPTFPTTFSNGALNPFLRCPDPLTCKGCPATMLTRPCIAPGCTGCVMHTPSAACSDMMMAFPKSFFNTYNPLMATTISASSSSTAQLAYQNLMAVASGHVPRHICNWIDSSGSICGKSLSTAEELATHMKIVHTPSSCVPSSTPANESKCTSPRSSSTPLFNHSQLRYHPYMKTTSTAPSVSIANPLNVSQFPIMPNFPSAAALQAMYTQRLMATMPHP